MKKIFTIVAAALIFAACNSKSDLDTQKDVVTIDTSRMYKSNASTDISSAQQINPAPTPQPAPQALQIRTIIHERTVYVNRTPKAIKQTILQAEPVEPVVATLPQAQANTGTTQNSGAATTSSTGTGTTAPVATPEVAPVEKKKGWSNAAKDAVIGGTVGAVGGAIIGKNKGKGAVIGGIIGAAGGYILGRKKDKSGIDYAGR